MSWAHYLLQVNIYLIVFYCFYKLLLARETYFVFNRVYLVISGILSLSIPFLRFEWLATQPVAQQMYVKVDRLNGFVSQVAIAHPADRHFNWGNLIVTIYMAGILFFILRFIFQLLSLRKVFARPDKGVAFSFFNKIAIAENIPEPATVNSHEEIHIKQGHTLDVLFFELIAIFTWFNPIIYAYKYTIKHIHEFLADEAAATFHGDKTAYSMLLLSQAFGAKPNDLAHGFFTKSLIKKRIFMLHKQRSKKVAILKYGLFVPLFALALMLSSATIRKNNGLIAVAKQIPLNNLQSVVSETIESPLNLTDTKTSGAQIILASEAGNDLSDKNLSWQKLYKRLATIVKSPSTASNQTHPENTRINFNIVDGRINSASVEGNLDQKTTQKIKTAVLSFSNKLAAKDGSYSLTADFPVGWREVPNLQVKNQASEPAVINLKLSDNNNQELAGTSDDQRYTLVSTSAQPVYPGGMKEFYTFLSSTLKYPAAAAENNIEGTVYVSFFIEKDGSLSNITSERKMGYGIDEEAIRAVKLSKAWTPGSRDGMPVRTKFSIPIRFALPLVTVTANGINYNGAVNGKPIVLIDGEKKDFSVLKDFDTSTIENISITKDAAAKAHYGKTARYGAIMITTKKINDK